MSALPTNAGNITLMHHMLSDAACMPKTLELYNCKISVLAATLMGSSVKPMVGASVMVR